MVPHILIIDADFGAAHATRALVAVMVVDALLAVEPTLARGRVHMEQHRADALIIDPSPHHVAAVQLIEWVKTERPATRVIVLASTTTAVLRQRIEMLGVDLYLEKHQPPTKLIGQLRSVLELIVRSPPAKLSPNDLST
jgi:DNA-binding NarL/FixJ family response regulator